MTEITSPIFRIAVTGHRFLSDPDQLTDSIRAVLEGMIQDHMNSEINLFSALAEGSDQLVAEVALFYPQIKLIVPLPLPEEEYLKGFATNIGKKAFYELTQNAHRMFTLSEQDDYLTAFEYLGNYLLDHCEVLLAIWNGDYTLKKGGTGELVKKALRMEKLIYWIYADNGNQEGEARRNLQKKQGDIEILGLSGDKMSFHNKNAR